MSFAATLQSFPYSYALRIQDTIDHHPNSSPLNRSLIFRDLRPTDRFGITGGINPLNTFYEGISEEREEVLELAPIEFICRLGMILRTVKS